MLYALNPSMSKGKMYHHQYSARAENLQFKQ